MKERWGLADCIEGCARHGIPGISPWRDVLQAMGVEAAARRIRDAGLTVTGLCRGGMFPAADAAGRAAAIEDNRRAIAEAHALGAACLVMVCGGLPPGSRDLPGARAMVRDGLHAILAEARAAGVTLALEPLHPMTCADRSVLSTLGQALDLCEEWARAPASRSMSTMSGGTRRWRGRWPAPRAASPPSTPATGWCRPPTWSSTAA